MVLEVNPGYADDPGHPGYGIITAVVADPGGLIGTAAAQANGAVRMNANTAATIKADATRTNTVNPVQLARLDLPNRWEDDFDSAGSESSLVPAHFVTEVGEVEQDDNFTLGPVTFPDDKSRKESNYIGTKREPLSAPAGSRRLYFYTPEMNLIVETELTASANPTIAYDYVWFHGHPVAQINEADNSVQYVFTDHLGTPILETSASQGVVWRPDYEPYGTVYALRSPDSHQPLRLPGQEAEQLNLGANGVTARSCNIFRWYQGDWGRYAEGDPVELSLASSDASLFMYAGNDPPNAIDPFGLYTVARPTVPLPSPQLDKFLHCLEGCIGKQVVVTATVPLPTEKHQDPGHAAGTSIDIRPPGIPSKTVFCCAGKCGAKWGLKETPGGQKFKYSFGYNDHFQLLPPHHPNPKAANMIPSGCSPNCPSAK